ncbi:erythromycin esterase family protein [Croceiramulus getboli]|nr:erythromycin esterase family protein [Flavobacteriaceae bacterium YJPT1-3]
MYEGNRSLKRKCDPETINYELRKNIGSVWSKTREFNNISSFLLQNCNELNLIGIDSNFSMTHYDFSRFFESLKTHYAIDKDPDLNFNHFEAILNTLVTQSYDANINSEDFVLLHNYLKTISERVKNHDDEDQVLKNYMLQEIKNLDLFARAIEAGISEGSKLRDEQMANNLLWTANNYYPNEKIIVWTANFHAANKLSEAIYNEDNNFYNSFITFAENVSDNIGKDKVFTVATLSTNGNYNQFNNIS